MGDNLYAIGDLHGSLASLERLMEKINPDLARDRLVFIGDYIDRGPEPKGVVDYIIRLKNQAPPEGIICLKGNHEAMFLDFLLGAPPGLFLFNGGRSTLQAYWGEDWSDRENLVLPPDHAQYYQDLRLYYETPDYIFVHGGLKPGVPLAGQEEEDLLWIRGEFITCPEDFGRRIIFGHTPFKQPLLMLNKIGIDTGAVYGNFLTAVKLPEVEFIFDRQP
ncbi:MAG TPA: metallophosphoesterase family protein [Desulfobaccales bacterium]|nr:metallophosphoesterase family protein [Desulfobaccales bacterium]